MKIIYQIRAWICRVFMQLELPIKILAKFAFVFLIFERVSAWEGFQSGLPFNSAAVHMILALLCILLPMRFATFFAIIIILYNIYQASFWGAIIAAVLLLVLYILISRLAPDETILMILMPLLMKTNLLIVPLFAGAFMGVFSIIPIVGGIVLWSFMRILPVFLKFDAGAIDELPELATETLSYIADQFVKNKELMFLMILCAGIVVVVWLLDKVNFNYMRYLAVIAGAAVGFVCLVVGRTTGMIEISVVDTVKMPVIAMLIMIFIEFFHIALNYKMSRRLEFADDEYYYYVKAIPKILALSRKPEIKTITDGRTQMIPTTEAIHTDYVKTDETMKESVREAVRESAPEAKPVQTGTAETEKAAKPEKQAKQAKSAKPLFAAFGFLNSGKDEEADKAEKAAEAGEPDETGYQAGAEGVEPAEPEETAADPEEQADQVSEEKESGAKPAIDLTNVKGFFAGLGNKAKKGFESAKGFVTDKVADIRKPKEEKAESEAEEPEIEVPFEEVEETVSETADLFAFESDDEDEILTGAADAAESEPAAGESEEPESAEAEHASAETANEASDESAKDRTQESLLSDLLPDDIRSEAKIENLKKDTGWTDETIRLFFDGLDEEDGKSGK